MGISIHYSGRLKSADSLPKLIEEVKDIAKSQKWKYHIFEEKFPQGYFGEKTYDDNIYGICFTPPECETVDLTFLSNGVLVSPFSLEYHLTEEPDKELTGTISVKTQFAGASLHKVLILMLEYLSKKYFGEFSLFDEAGFWETRDEKLMEKNFKFLGDLINSFQAHIETIPMKQDEAIEAYLLRIAKGIKDQEIND